ncbi:MAG: hypothetical protein P9M01_03225 [Candidatus Kappaea frigidicola]|nr:hypothetical protein [Candidatus Kappaea frigidicola]
MKSKLIKIFFLTLILLCLGINGSYAQDELPQEYYAYVEGQVIYSSGEALSGVKISIYNEKLGGYSALTDTDGNYALKVPSEWKAFPGTPYKVFISKEDFPAMNDSIRVIQQKTYKKNYTLSLDKDSFAIEGIVYYKDVHIPIQGARVTLRPKGSKNIISFSESNQDGAFQLYLSGSLKNKKNEYIMSGDKEGCVSFEKQTTYDPEKIYNVYLDDVTPPLIPDIEADTFVTNKTTYKLTGTKEPQTSLFINKVEKVAVDNKESWTTEVSLRDGENICNLHLVDAAGNIGPEKTITITKDNEAPLILQISPENHSVLDSAAVSIRGVLADTAGIKCLKVNNQIVTVSDEGFFSISNINLNTGKNIFVIVIEDTAGNIANYGYELFSQIYVEGENLKNRKVNQPEIPSEEFNTPTDNPFTATTKNLTGSSRVMKKIGSKTLDVIYEPKSNNRIVLVTAAWLEENDRKVKG